MVRPDHFRVDYRINPFMDPTHQPDPGLTRAQWDALVAAIRAAGAEVEVIEQRPDAPDMVYAMNLGFVVERPGSSSAGHVVLSHMRYPERRMETPSAAAWFAGRGFGTSYVGRDGVGAYLEAGDAFAWGDALVVGHGPRTDELGLKALATELGIRVRGLRITHPGMYHLDLAFCPLDDRRAILCPAAFDDESAEALLALVPEPLVITEEEALTTFAANSVVVGRTVVMPACPDQQGPAASAGLARIRARLEGWGFEVVLVDVSQFHLGGGSVRCLTNPLDVRLGRDIPLVPGGEVVLP
jgi:N-dimethylarginine dimethylaminohydrolase